MAGPYKRPTPNVKTSAVKAPTTVGGAVGRGSYYRFDQNPNIKTTVGAAAPRGNTTSQTNQNNTNNNNNKGKQPMPTRAQMLEARAKKSKPAQGCIFNLPPHAWSLPIRPLQVIGDAVGSTMDAVIGSDIHKNRRGVIWFYSTGSEITVTDASGNVTTAQAAKEEGLTDEQKKEIKANSESSDGESKDFNYGFQFLWNPENISVAVARNMDVTPSSADRLRSVSGAFPGQENVQFTIVLDRVNDFAALAGASGSKKAEKSPYPSYGDDFKNQYKYGLSDSSAEARVPMNQKIYELSRYGTMADLEYLFKAINGAGPGTGWVTLLNKKTADIGFLSPTLLAFRFGPDSQESLSFVGWITNLSITHTMFTENMIPLRTTVNVSVDCFAGSTIV